MPCGSTVDGSRVFAYPLSSPLQLSHGRVVAMVGQCDRNLLQTTESARWDFRQEKYRHPGLQAPRLHYLFHYVWAVILKGALPSFSTDRTEIWHKGPKSLYSDSGKHHWMPFVLKGVTVAEAFHNKISCFQTQRSGEDGENTDVNGDPDSSDESGEDDDIHNPSADLNSLENICGQNGDTTSNTVDDVGDVNGQTTMETTQSATPKHAYIWPKPRGYRRK